MDLKPVNSINNDSNTIRVSDGNSPIRLIFKDAKGEVINLYDKIDYFYLTKDDEQFYSVTDISYDGDEVIIRLPKLRKGQYKAEIRDKDGSIYPANEDLYILLRRSFEDDKDLYYFGHREDILNSVEPMVIQHIEENTDKFKGEQGVQGLPGIDGKNGIDGKDGKEFTVIDAESGVITHPTTIKDPNGKDVLRFVDSAPFAYDEINDTKKIALRKSVQVSEIFSLDVVNPSASEQILISPDAYTIGEIKDFGMFFPSIAESTGTHSVDIAVGDIGGYRSRRLYSVNKNSSENILIDFESDLKELLKGIVFSPELPLTILYRNHSNLDQTGYKFVYALYIQEVVAL